MALGGSHCAKAHELWAVTWETAMSCGARAPATRTAEVAGRGLEPFGPSYLPVPTPGWLGVQGRVCGLSFEELWRLGATPPSPGSR